VVVTAMAIHGKLGNSPQVAMEQGKSKSGRFVVKATSFNEQSCACSFLRSGVSVSADWGLVYGSNCGVTE